MYTAHSTLTYLVSAMSCDHCINAITEEVTKVEGVSNVDIDLETKVVVVRGMNLVDARIRRAIDEAGFEASS
jgi:copper chaperone